MFDKRELRKCVKEKAPTKQVLSYFAKKGNAADYAVVSSIASVSNKRILCLFWYSSDNKLAYISYISKDAEIITRSTSSVKWFTSNISDLPFISSHYDSNIDGYTENKSYELMNNAPIYSFFDITKNESALAELKKILYRKTESKRVEKIKSNAIRKCRQSCERFEKLDKIPRGLKQWAKRTVLGYDGYFNLDDRHTVHCSHCDKDFSVTDDVKCGSKHTCPHCHFKLTAKTLKKVSSQTVKGFQCLSRMGEKVFVRHFTITRNISSDTGKITSYSFYEYERDEMTPDDANFSFKYNIHRTHYGVDEEYWSTKKPYAGPHIWGTLKNLYYENEPLYIKNVNEVLKGTSYEHSELKNVSFAMRAEEYLHIYNLMPCIEQLLKAGYTKLVEDCLYNKLNVDAKATSITEIFGMNRTFCNYVKDNNLNVSEVNCLKSVYRNNLNISDYEKLLTYSKTVYTYNLNNTALEVINLYKILPVTFNKLIKYLTVNKISVANYTDYINQYGSLINGNWNRHSLYPLNFDEAHDSAIANVKIMKSKELNDALMKIYLERFAKIDNYVIGGYVFKFPSSQQDFIDEGNNQGNCVGRNGYDKCVVRGDSIICFMRKQDNPDESYITIEYQITKENVSLRQCFLSHNRNASEKEETIAKKFIDDVLMKNKNSVAA